MSSNYTDLFIFLFLLVFVVVAESVDFRGGGLLRLPLLLVASGWWSLVVGVGGKGNYRK